MTGQEQIAIVKYVPFSVLKKRIKHHKGLPEVLPRLLFIRLWYTGISVVKAADAVGASGQTGYNWQERWNVDSFEGLVPRYAGGHPSKLTDEQKAELLELLREQDHWTTVGMTLRTWAMSSVGLHGTHVWCIIPTVLGFRSNRPIGRGIRSNPERARRTRRSGISTPLSPSSSRTPRSLCCGCISLR